MNLYEELIYRGLIKDVSNEDIAKDLLNNKKSTFYCGFDPTADSLHVGHLVQIIRALLMQKHGHKPIVLVGGATGLIGDPSGKKTERQLLTLDKSLENAESIKKQLEKYLDFDGDNGTILVNNYDWISKINMIEFLRDYGKNFSINYMLAKESVASRIDNGISYTEFSYMLIQAIDFLHLYKKYDCNIQFGGSEQWGNITAGLELIRKTCNDDLPVLGLSSPLLVKADGSKFGKTGTETLWIDINKTSAYAIYQYFLNTSDDEVISFLKMLTLLDKEIIEKLEQEVLINPEKRAAQKELAKEIIIFLHGEKEYKKVEKITNCLFIGTVLALSEEEIEIAFSDVPSSEIEQDLNIVDLLVESNVTKSKREARELITSNAITVNDKIINDLEYIVSVKEALYNKYTIIRRGKKKFYLIKHKKR